MNNDPLDDMNASFLLPNPSRLKPSPLPDWCVGGANLMSRSPGHPTFIVTGIRDYRRGGGDGHDSVWIDGVRSSGAVIAECLVYCEPLLVASTK